MTTSKLPNKAIIFMDDHPDSSHDIVSKLEDIGFEIHSTQTWSDTLEMFYVSPPVCIIVRYRLACTNDQTSIKEIRNDNIYGHIPIIAVLTAEDIKGNPDWTQAAVDDFFVDNCEVHEIATRIHLCVERSIRDISANPLSGLPGNLTITREAERRLAEKQAFAFAYLDVDSFKAFNDKYGFARGDEVLRMTARILVNVVRSLDSSDTYVGHIGGDDFVFIIPSDSIQKVCKRICDDFDLVVRDFYDVADRDKGSIQSKDRQGRMQTFPLLSISMGVVDTKTTPISHVADLFTKSNEVKSYAKRVPGSNYIIDRRHT